MGYTRSYVDDLDGTLITERDKGKLRFSVDDVSYEIDLTNENFERFKAAVEPFTKVARVVTESPLPAFASRSQGRAYRNAMRNWLRDQGHQLSARGRIPAELVDLYVKSHPNS